MEDLKCTAAARLNQHLFSSGNQVKSEKKSKFRNQRVEDNGVFFDSKKELKRYKELRLLLKAGKIGFLARQVEYPLMIEGEKAASYIADFQYTDSETGETIVEDVKSDITRKLPVYRLKKKMMLLQHKIKIKEV